MTTPDPLRCRYSDCPEGHPVARATDNEPPEPIAATFEEEERVTCETCREAMGLPTIAEDAAAEQEPADPALDIVDREDGTSPNERKAFAALGTFIDAAMALDRAWDPALDAGYPARLPSFDEFVGEIIAWRDTAEGKE